MRAPEFWDRDPGYPLALAAAPLALAYRLGGALRQLLVYNTNTILGAVLETKPAVTSEPEGARGRVPRRARRPP